MNFQEPAQQHTAVPPSPPRVASPAQQKRAVRLAAVALLAVLAALFAYDRIREHFKMASLAANQPPPVPVVTEVIKPTTLPQSLTATGSITAVHQVTIAPEVEGRITRIAFAAGAAVKKGDVLVQLNDAPEQADLAAARAQQKLAQVALTRAQRLTENGYVSQAQLDQAQSQYDAATANIGKIAAIIAQKQIHAPFDGVLGVRLVEVGQYLSAGAAITTLTQTTPLYINFTLPEQARPALAVGQEIALGVDAYPERTFPGRIAVIDPQIMADTRTVRVQAEADNPDGLLASGMFAKVNVKLPARPDVLTVPETAVDYTLYGNSVFVVREDKDQPGHGLKAYRVAVDLGEHADNRVAVTGINPGDRVVIMGQTRLFEGAQVTLSDGAPPAPPRELPLH